MSVIRGGSGQGWKRGGSEHERKRGADQAASCEQALGPIAFESIKDRKMAYIHILTSGNVFQSQAPDILIMRPHMYARENAGDRRCNAGWGSIARFPRGEKDSIEEKRREQEGRNA
jgi:hypothetical protein